MKILFIGTPARGHVSPSLHIVKSLVKKGHTVLYCLPKSFDVVSYKETIKALGAEYCEVNNYFLDKKFLIIYSIFTLVQQFDNIFEALKVSYYLIKNYHQGLSFFSNKKYSSIFTLEHTFIKKSEFEYQEITKSIDIESIDIVMGDSLAWSAKNLAFKEKLPYIMSEFNIISHQIKEHTFFKPIIDLYHTDIVVSTLVDDLFSNYFLENSFYQFIDYFDQPPYYTLCYSSSLLFYKGSIVPQPYYYDKFIFLGNRELKYLKNTDSSNSTNIFVSLGTELNSNELLFSNIFTALNKENYKSIISFGGNEVLFKKFNQTDTPYISKNLFVEQEKILSTTHVYFSHAGANSVYEAVYYKVPMILIPQGYDQFNNAKVIEQLGLGLVIDNNKSIEMALETVLKNYQFYEKNLEVFQKSFLQAMNGNQAAERIEYLFKNNYKQLLLNDIYDTYMDKPLNTNLYQSSSSSIPDEL